MMLFSIHTILAGVTKIPEMQIDPVETSQMAKAICNVQRHYDVAVTQKTLDWGNLITAAVMVYGTRLFAVARRKRAAAAEQGVDPSTGAVIIPGVGPARFN